MTLNKTKYTYVIIGAGIAGLVAAYHLKKLGQEFLLFEKSDRIGGAIDTRHFESTIYEFGPNSFLSNSKPIMELIEELGLTTIAKDFVTSKRYIYREGLIDLPVNPIKFLFSPVVSLLAKLRLIISLFSYKKIYQGKDLVVYDFIARKFGREIAEIFHTALKGIWAGDSKKLSAESVLKKLIALEKDNDSLFTILLTKSKTKKQKMQTLSFAEGMQVLVDALVDNIGRQNIVLEADLKIVDYNQDLITLKLASGEHLKAANLIISSPAFAAAAILESTAPEVSSQLAQIDYAPVYLFALVVDKSLFKSEEIFDAFGYLPVGDDLSTLGTIFSSQLFEQRNLLDKYLFTCFAKFNDVDQIIREQIMVFAPYAKRKLEPSDFLVLDTKHITRAIPQYYLNHQLKLAKIETELQSFQNIKLCGNYLYGVSLADTINLSSSIDFF